MKKAIINTTLYDFETFQENAYVIFGDTITKTGPMEDFKDDGHMIIDGTDRIVLPGMVAGHTHIYSALSRGMSVRFDPKDFMGILEDLWWKMDREIDTDIAYASGIVSATDHILCGVTTLIDHHASGRAVTGTLDTLERAVTKDVGIRGVFAFETSDRFDTASCIDENRSYLDKPKDGMSAGLFGLHASISLSDKTLSAVRDALQGDPVHIHVAESRMDQDDATRRYGMRVIQRLDKYGLITEGSILAHAIHVDDIELDIIKKRGAVIAVNVTSNMNNGVGLPDLVRFRDKGIPVIIGNDGINPSMACEYRNVLFSSHHRDQTPVRFSTDDLIRMIRATYDKASEALGVGLGRIRKGYAADLSVLPYIPPTPMDKDNVFSHLTYGLFHAYVPEHVFVAGAWKVRGHKIDSELRTRYKEAVQCARVLWDRIKEGETHETQYDI
jgi:cytosine/adenosine deaminase-related metal-dependent hydrolase